MPLAIYCLRADPLFFYYSKSFENVQGGQLQITWKPQLTICPSVASSKAPTTPGAIILVNVSPAKIAGSSFTPGESSRETEDKAKLRIF